MLKGRKGLVLGVANQRSIAMAIAHSAHHAGAEIALTYASERFRQNVERLGMAIGSEIILPCDVSRDEEITTVFERLRDRWGYLDFMVHAIAFANRNELNGAYLNTSRDGFRVAHDISVYSLTALTRAAFPLMQGRPGSILTLSYIGAERVVPNYNVMGVSKAALEASVRYLAADLGPHGIRVNAISAGPIKTLSAAGVSNLSALLDVLPQRSPLRRNVTAGEVGDAAVFLLSDMARAITGVTLYVDCGLHILGVCDIACPDPSAHTECKAGIEPAARPEAGKPHPAASG
ncbi:MAG: enoyl-ACP reductase [Planctomycetota bacterium]